MAHRIVITVQPCCYNSPPMNSGRSNLRMHRRRLQPGLPFFTGSAPVLLTGASRGLFYRFSVELLMVGHPVPDSTTIPPTTNVSLLAPLPPHHQPMSPSWHHCHPTRNQCLLPGIDDPLSLSPSSISGSLSIPWSTHQHQSLHPDVDSPLPMSTYDTWGWGSTSIPMSIHQHQHHLPDIDGPLPMSPSCTSDSPLIPMSTHQH